VKSNISVYILAYNEASKIGDAVKSVLWADEVVVADSYRKDGTADIAASLGVRVVQIPHRLRGAPKQSDWRVQSRVDSELGCG
jgi:glycosyltransferase involved in cell wall biosynthesis